MASRVAAVAIRELNPAVRRRCAEAWQLSARLAGRIATQRCFKCSLQATAPRWPCGQFRRQSWWNWRAGRLPRCLNGSASGRGDRQLDANLVCATNKEKLRSDATSCLRADRLHTVLTKFWLVGDGRSVLTVRLLWQFRFAGATVGDTARSKNSRRAYDVEKVASQLRRDQLIGPRLHCRCDEVRRHASQQVANVRRTWSGRTGEAANECLHGLVAGNRHVMRNIVNSSHGQLVTGKLRKSIAMTTNVVHADSITNQTLNLTAA